MPGFDDGGFDQEGATWEDLEGWWQLTLPDGTVIGDGTDWPFDADGPDLFSQVGLRYTDTARPNTDGLTSPASDRLDGRALTCGLRLEHDAQSVLLDRMSSLAAACAPSAGIVEVVASGPFGRYAIRGKTMPLDTPSTATIKQGVLRPIWRFRQLDPYLYRPVYSTGTTGAGTHTGGFGSPFGSPFGGGTILPGRITLTNDGTAPAKPTIVLAAGSDDLVDPTLVLVETGETLSFDLTIAAGRYLIVDINSRQVLLTSRLDDLSATADRAGTVRRPDAADWFSLPPGTSTVELTATDAAADAAAEISWRDPSYS